MQSRRVAVRCIRPHIQAVVGHLQTVGVVKLHGIGRPSRHRVQYHLIVVNESRVNRRGRTATHIDAELRLSHLDVVVADVIILRGQVLGIDAILRIEDAVHRVAVDVRGDDVLHVHPAELLVATHRILRDVVVADYQRHGVLGVYAPVAAADTAILDGQAVLPTVVPRLRVTHIVHTEVTTFHDTIAEHHRVRFRR